MIDLDSAECLKSELELFSLPGNNNKQNKIFFHLFLFLLKKKNHIIFKKYVI